MNIEFRRAKRRKVEQRVEVLDLMSERVLGHLSDLAFSPAGSAVSDRSTSAMRRTVEQVQGHEGKKTEDRRQETGDRRQQSIC